MLESHGAFPASNRRSEQRISCRKPPSPLCLGEYLPNALPDLGAARMFEAGVEVVTYARLFGADADTACFQHITAQEPIVFEGVDTLVISFGRLSDRELEREIDGIREKCHIIGDCLAPRTADEAVLEGLKVGFRL